MTYTGTKRKEAMGVSRPQPRKFLPFRRAKVVAKCTSARQFTEQRGIGDLLLLKEVNVTDKNLTGQPLRPPQVS